MQKNVVMPFSIKKNNANPMQMPILETLLVTGEATADAL